MPLVPSDSLQTAPAQGMLAVPRRNPHAYQIKQWELVLPHKQPRLSSNHSGISTLTRSPLFFRAQRLSFVLAEVPSLALPSHLLLMFPILNVHQPQVMESIADCRPHVVVSSPV